MNTFDGKIVLLRLDAFPDRAIGKVESIHPFLSPSLSACHSSNRYSILNPLATADNRITYMPLFWCTIRKYQINQSPPSSYKRIETHHRHPCSARHGTLPADGCAWPAVTTIAYSRGCSELLLGMAWHRIATKERHHIRKDGYTHARSRRKSRRFLFFRSRWSSTLLHTVYR
jgi:hypothetical protein